VAGLAVAWHAAQQQRPVTVWEREQQPGGLARTFEHQGQLFDAGAHRLHAHQASFVHQLQQDLGLQLHSVRAPSGIRERGRTFAFPPRPGQMLLSQGALGIPTLLLDLLVSRLGRSRAGDLEAALRRRFGRRLSERFLLPYNQKLWGSPPSQLAASAATRRLAGLSLPRMLGEALGLMEPEHLEGSFLYPEAGIGQLADALAAALPAGSLRLGSEVTTLDCSQGRIVGLHVHGTRPIRVEGPVVSTIPLPRLVQALGANMDPAAQDAARGLRYRHLRLVFLRLAQASVSSHATLYFPEPGVCFTRVSEPRNRSAAMAPPGETGLLAEVACDPGDPIHRLPDEILARRVIDDLAAVGLVRPQRLLSWSHRRLPCAYPVPALDAPERLARIKQALAPLENLAWLGRTGAFAYEHLHHQLKHAASRRPSL